MESSDNNFCRAIPLWKWILLFIGGIICFTLIYGLTTMAATLVVEGPWVKTAVSLGCAAVSIWLYRVIIGKVENRKVSEIDSPASMPLLGKGLLVGVALFVTVAGLLAIPGLYKVTGISFDALKLLESFCFFSLVAVGEELIFRGIIFRMIERRWNVAAALVVSSLLFGFMHLPNPGATVWSSIAIAIEAGLLLGAAYACYDNLWLPIGIPWAWNFMEGPVLGCEVSGQEYGYTLLQSQMSGAPWLSGGVFGPEASVITVALGLALSLYFIRIYIKKNNKSQAI